VPGLEDGTPCLFENSLVNFTILSVHFVKCVSHERDCILELADSLLGVRSMESVGILAEGFDDLSDLLFPALNDLVQYVATAFLPAFTPALLVEVLPG